MRRAVLFGVPRSPRRLPWRGGLARPRTILDLRTFLTMLALTAWLLVLGSVFAICRWGGGLLATHHNDGHEVAATLLVGTCVLAAVALVTRDWLPGGTLALGVVAVAVGGGLFAGYARREE